MFKSLSTDSLKLLRNIFLKIHQLSCPSFHCFCWLRNLPQNIRRNLREHVDFCCGPLNHLWMRYLDNCPRLVIAVNDFHIQDFVWVFQYQCQNDAEQVLDLLHVQLSWTFDCAQHVFVQDKQLLSLMMAWIISISKYSSSLQQIIWLVSPFVNPPKKWCSRTLTAPKSFSLFSVFTCCSCLQLHVKLELALFCSCFQRTSLLLSWVDSSFHTWDWSAGYGFVLAICFQKLIPARSFPTSTFSGFWWSLLSCEEK